MNKRDNWQTPNIAMDYLLPYIPSYMKTVWEPACGEMNIVKYLAKEGFTVTATDIKMGQDFFTGSHLGNYDIQITNPPYSLTDKWLEHSFRLDRPFALLLPIYALHSGVRCKMYSKHQIQVIVPPKRIAFIKPPNKKPKKGDKPPFAAVWVTWGLNLENDLVYIEDKP